ncbi:MAG: hypothetical protein K6B14_10055 [Lachnospiraceae bacterium]|nr:hypothetical protein [Lachnospiraceae bacterium]
MNVDSDGNVKELRAQTGMSQREFANYFDIPLRTYENWEADKGSDNNHRLKAYWLKLMEYKLRNEGVIQ